jgi:hypothetical protein
MIATVFYVTLFVLVLAAALWKCQRCPPPG